MSVANTSVPVELKTRPWELVSVIQELSLADTHQEVRDIVRHAARRLVGADGATFVLQDDGHCFYVDEDAISPLWKGSRFPMEICISGWAMMNKQSVVIPDVFQDDRIPHDVYRQTFVKGMAMMPIRRSDPIGAIGVYWAKEYTVTDEELQLLQALADTTSVALENIETLNELEQRVVERTKALDEANAQLLEMTLTDPMTGVRNRRGFDLLASHELELSHRQQIKCALAYVDVNGLKVVNDTLGHKAGDRLIKEVADILTQVGRESDVIGRLGGDEFAIMIASNTEQAHRVTERIQAEIDNRNQQPNREFMVSVSIGLVEGSNTKSLAELINEADEAMYLEKLAYKQQRT